MPGSPRSFAPKLKVPFESLSKPVRGSLVWRDTRLRPAPKLSQAPALGGFSLMVSNRTVWDQSATYPDGFWTDDTVPLLDGTTYTLNWYTSTLANDDANPSDFFNGSPVASPGVPGDLKRSVVGLLQRQSSPSLTVFIHGLGNLFSDAIAGTAALGSGLKTYGGYGGLVIGFDWPSYDETTSGVDYASTPYSFPPVNTSGTIRDNINGSVTAFDALVTFLTGLRTAVPGLSLSLVCHSEGNYMAMVGFNGASTQVFDHVIMLAADVNDGALLSPADAAQYQGQGQGIYQSSGDVTVYWTTNDYVLYESGELLGDYHNPNYQVRLGYSGMTGSQSGQAGNVYSVDCSNVLDETNVEGWVSSGVIPAQDSVYPEIHSAYLYVPQVLNDMAQVIMGVSQASIADRQQAGSSQWFTMTFEGLNWTATPS